MSEPTAMAQPTPKAQRTRLAMRTADLTLHPALAEVPEMGADDYADLKASIERDGILTPLSITADGTVWEGRHRLRAALEIGLLLIPVTLVLPPDDPTAFAITTALTRRQLTLKQQVDLAARLPKVVAAVAAAKAAKSAGKPKDDLPPKLSGRSEPKRSTKATAISEALAEHGTKVSPSTVERALAPAKPKAAPRLTPEQRKARLSERAVVSGIHARNGADRLSEMSRTVAVWLRADTTTRDDIESLMSMLRDALRFHDDALVSGPSTLAEREAVIEAGLPVALGLSADAKAKKASDKAVEAGLATPITSKPKDGAE